MTTTSATGETAWYSMTPDQTASGLGVDYDQGLGPTEVDRRMREYGPNKLPVEPPPSLWVVARGQLTNPMNIMLIIVSIASFAIGQVGTGIFVAGLVTFN